MNEFEKYKKISFPLNVYAFITYYETGEFRELHYGLFQDENDDLVTAQKNSTDLLFKHLYQSPAKVLEVGIGLGKTHQKLMDKGFECTGITPDAAQIAIVKESIPDANLICTRLENFKAEEQYDILLFQESAQYIPTEALFSKAKALLKNNGRILIIDEFSINGDTLHDVHKFKNNALKHGIELVESIDLSELAKPTEDHILDSLKLYRVDLQDTLSLEPGIIDYLIDTIMKHKEGYNKKTRGYFFFEFRKKQNPRSPYVLDKQKMTHHSESIGQKMIAKHGFDKNFEKNETKLVEKVIQKGDVIVDIGANIGFYTLKFSKLTGPKGHVHAFEPDKKNYKLLEEHTLVDKCENTSLINKGVSSKNGLTKLYISDINIGMHRAYKSIVCSDHTIEVEMIKLDDYFKDSNTKIDFLKIDIEGFEYFAFSGMTQLLNSNKDIKIMTEFSPLSIIESGTSHLELINIFDDLNLELYDIDNNLNQINIQDIKEQLKVLEQNKNIILKDIPNFTRENIVGIEQQLQKRLADIGYRRKIFENFFIFNSSHENNRDITNWL